MTVIVQKDFTGEFPRSLPHVLPDGAAQFAQNCDFTLNALGGIRASDPVSTIYTPSAKSIFIYDNINMSYFYWQKDVDAVRSPVASDAYSRFYWCDGTNFWVSRGDVGSGSGEPSSNNKYKVGVPRPSAAMTVSGSSNTFAVSGYRPNSFTAFCEKAGGTRGTVTPLTITPGTSTLGGYTATAAASIVCNASSGSSRGGTAAQISKLAVEVTFINSAGKTLTAVLRDDSNANTYPPELAGLTGSYTYNGSTISLSLSSRSDYLDARGYVYTYVNQYGEEGPPSDPLVLDVAEGSTPSLRYTPLPTGLGYAPVSKIRVYRTATGTSNTDYLFVGEVVINTTNPVFSDTVATAALGEALQTRGYYPPDQNLRGLCALPNGILAAFKGNEVHFSEPYLPYAWKTSNIQTLQNRVVGLCPSENGLYVTTTAHPVLISGMAPDSMTAQKITAIQGGVSKGSICNVGPYVVYASNDGLVMLRGLDASLDMSFKFFTRDVWRERYGAYMSRMRLNTHDGHILGWFEDGSLPAFLVRFDEAAPSFTKLSDYVTYAVVHPEADALYVGVGNTISGFKNSAGRLGFRYWTKDYILPVQTNLGCLQLVGDGAITVTVYADGAVVYSAPVRIDKTGRTVVRLPSGFRARRWSFMFDGPGNAILYEYAAATSPMELQGV